MKRYADGGGQGWRIDGALIGLRPIPADSLQAHYLRTRGFDSLLPHERRVLKAAEFALARKDGKGQAIPARGIVAPLSSVGGSTIATQTLVLTPGGFAETDKDGVKMRVTRGMAAGAAIRLAPPVDGVVGLAEGLEDAMSVTRLTGIPCWSACGAGVAMWGEDFLPERIGICGFKIPPEVTQLIVFADNDEPGIFAARELQARYPRKVEIRYPSSGKDWNDMWRAAK